jgi:DnaK suppressor protein
MNAKELKRLRTVLEEDRARLASDLADLEKAQSETLSDMSGENNYRDHMADQGSATFAKELDMTLEENLRDLLAQVDKALARMDAGEYGVCRSCGKKIAAPRLEAMPAADQCVECKEREESY